MPPLHPAVRCTIDGRELFSGIARSAEPERLGGIGLTWTMIDDPDATEPALYFTLTPPRSIFDAIAFEMEDAITDQARRIAQDTYRPGDHVLGEIMGLMGLGLATHDDRVDALAYGMRHAAEIRPPFRLDVEDDIRLHPAGIACWKCHRTHSPQAACRR